MQRKYYILKTTDIQTFGLCHNNCQHVCWWFYQLMETTSQTAHWLISVYKRTNAECFSAQPNTFTSYPSLQDLSRSYMKRPARSLGWFSIEDFRRAACLCLQCLVILVMIQWMWRHRLGQDSCRQEIREPVRADWNRTELGEQDNIIARGNWEQSETRPGGKLHQTGTGLKQEWRRLLSHNL